MYFSGELAIDPASLTHFKRVKPAKAFAKLLYYLTVGAVGTRKEVETFTAVSVLQSLHAAVHSAGIDNIVRLACDADDLYIDRHGQDDDLQQAIEAFATQATPKQARKFELLQLVCEHDDGVLTYLIDIQVRRRHLPGKYPILLRFNAVANAARTDPDQANVAGVSGVMAASFVDQTAFDAFADGGRAHFDKFVARVGNAIGKHMAVDNITASARRCIVLPSTSPTTADALSHDYDDPDVVPILAGYPGFDASFFYVWVFGRLCFDRNVRLRNVTVVDTRGKPMFEIGDDGFSAGASDTLDPSTPFHAPATKDVHYFRGHAFDEAFEELELVIDPSFLDPLVEASAGDANTDAWLDILAPNDDDDC